MSGEKESTFSEAREDAMHMIRVNLLPTREIRALRRKRRALVSGAAVLLLTAAALAAGNISQHRRGNALESDLAVLRQKVAAMRVAAKDVTALEEMVKQARLKNRAVTAWLERRAEHPRVLRGLATAAPEKLWLTRYAESEDATVLEGEAMDDESIARFLRGLSGTFETRNIVEAGQAAEGEGLRRFVVHGRNGLPPNAAPPPTSGPRIKLAPGPGSSPGQA